MILTGAGFGEHPEYLRCRIGAAIVGASLTAADTIRCARAPSATAVGASLSFDSNFSVGGRETPITLGGSAAAVDARWSAATGNVEGGYLRLCDGGDGEAGAEAGGLSAVESSRSGSVLLASPLLYSQSGCTPPLGECAYAPLQPTPLPRVDGFSVDFRMRLGGALGVSFSFGNISDPFSPEGIGGAGTGDGLRLLWRAPTSSELELAVVQDESELYKASLASLSSAWREGFLLVHATCSEAGILNVAIDGLTVVDALQLPLWQPAAGWRFVWGAECAAASTPSCALDDLHLLAGAAERSQDAPVDVSLDGQYFSGGATLRYTMPRVSSISPSSGLAAGGEVLVVRGSGFDGGTGPSPSCRFGSATASAATRSADARIIRCVSPDRSEFGTETLGLEVSADGVSFSMDGLTYLSTELPPPPAPAPSPPPLPTPEPPRVSAISPAIGFPLGGTGVAVHGSGFASGYGYRCRFTALGVLLQGQLRLPAETAASFVDEATVRCASASASAAGGAVALSGFESFSVEGAAAGGGTAGGSTPGYSMLNLTTGIPSQVGHATSGAISPPLNGSWVASFSLSSFELVAASAEGGGGLVSFEFGTLNASDTPGSGLVVAFDARGDLPHLLDVSVRGITSSGYRRRLDVSMRASSAREIRVALDAVDGSASLISITFDGLSLLEHEPLVGCCTPTDAWAVRLSAETCAGVECDSHTVLGFEMEDTDPKGALHRPLAAVAVAFEGGQYSDDPVVFEYAPTPDVSAVLPSSGPSSGGTLVRVSGVNFAPSATRLLCYFALPSSTPPSTPLDADEWAALPVTSVGTRVADDALLCVTPPSSAGESHLRVSLNGEQSTMGGTNFTYYAIPSVNEVSPLSGPVEGGTLMRVVGSLTGSGSAPSCRFNGVSSGGSDEAVAATYVDTGQPELRCYTPGALQSAVTYMFDVSPNANDYTSTGIVFGAYTPPSLGALSPASGGDGGGTAVTITHAFVDPAHTTPRCRWTWPSGRGFVVVDATQVAATETRCVSPPFLSNASVVLGGAGSALHPRYRLAKLELAPNGQQFLPRPPFTFNGQQFAEGPPLDFTYFHPTVSATIPSVGPAAGGYQVLVLGEGFSPLFESLSLRFGGDTSTALERMNDSALSWTVAAGGVVSDAVEVSLNGREFSEDGVTFARLPLPLISSLTPSLGPLDGGTQLRIAGYGLDAAAAQGSYVCRFDAQNGGEARAHVDVAASRDDSADEVLCGTPPMRALLNGTNETLVRIHVRVLLNVDPRSPDGLFVTAAAFFEYHPPLVVRALAPASLITSGASVTIGVQADALAHLGTAVGFSCRFTGFPGGDRTLAGTYIASDADSSGYDALMALENASRTPRLPRVECSFVPPLLARGEAIQVGVQLSVNGQQYGGEEFGGEEGARSIFTLHPPAELWSVAPLAGPVRGGTLAYLRGAHLSHGAADEYLCLFGGIPQVGTYLAGADALRCTAPAQPQLEELWDLGGAQTAHAGCELIRWGSRGPARGVPGGLFTVGEARGAPVRAGAAPPGMQYHSAHNATHLWLCPSPPPEVPSDTRRVQLTTNAQDLSTPNATFRYVPAAQVVGVEPSHGAASGGGATLRVYGEYFSDAVDWSCRVGLARSPAERVSSGELLCAAPPAVDAGAADVLRLDFETPALGGNPELGAPFEASSPSAPSPPVAPVVTPAPYTEPEQPRLETLRITSEPQPEAIAGISFEGELRFELLDQWGSRYVATDHRVRVSLLREQGATLPAEASLDVLPNATVVTLGGEGAFRSLTIDQLGTGGYFTLSLDRVNDTTLSADTIDTTTISTTISARTARTYSVRIGAAAMLRFLIEPPTAGNLQDVYFAQQPQVEVTDLLGNRLTTGEHRVTLALTGGTGRLRGPKVRYTRAGVGTFQLLRVKAAGYDKVITASAPGLLSATTAPFAILPNGIPHQLRMLTPVSWRGGPPPRAISYETIEPLRVVLEDVYGVRAAAAPSRLVRLSARALNADTLWFPPSADSSVTLRGDEARTPRADVGEVDGAGHRVRLE